MSPLSITQLLHPVVFTQKDTLLHNIVLPKVVAPNPNLTTSSSQGALKPQLNILRRAPLLPQQYIGNLLTVSVHQKLWHPLILSRQGDVLFKSKLVLGIHICSNKYVNFQ